ncbi:hypothetical protein A3B87_02430 [Candidatus Kuenenbacteria bacterium RIFCSPHIGHO2_02_FULL_39_13]|uniref:PRC-barrel domain-containing protein n=1 Tax=Candidatus Kuenenbacteria bacterium RIFCSPHIGHO2_02_FULL_39_13 TaxID=1798561 RepID=A0A1F6FNZ4_9BACT|nr:MAG: hypothetical protein A3B87_02430 [Candidatus Kuenenbacteria bacterium RIFCSPHIGHO2_02_FULL_39_13]
MKINSKQLKNLPAQSESGQDLGVLESFNVDVESQSIIEYNIKPSSLIKELVHGDLIISRGQVIDITEKKIIVKDAFSKKEILQKVHQVLEKKKSVALNKKQE